MNVIEYQEKAKRTMAELGHTMDNIHMCLGLQTESAELSDVFKKLIAYEKPVDWVNVKEELGDLMWYVANMCSINNWDLQEIMATNIKKLEARYPEKFTTDKAVNRDLDSERKILEEPRQSIKDKILSETSEEAKQKARDYGVSLAAK